MPKHLRKFIHNFNNPGTLATTLPSASTSANGANNIIVVCCQWHHAPGIWHFSGWMMTSWRIPPLGAEIRRECAHLDFHCNSGNQSKRINWDSDQPLTRQSSGLRKKCTLLLFDPNYNWNVLTNFLKLPSVIFRRNLFKGSRVLRANKHGKASKFIFATSIVIFHVSINT